MAVSGLAKWLLVISALFGATRIAAADPAGFWLDKDGTTIRVEHCGPALCGTIERLAIPIDPATRQPWTDKLNPDPALRSRPLVGLQVFIAMQPSGTGTWSGQLYDSDKGKSFDGHLIELGPDTLRVEGCLLFLCGGENLKRIAQ